MRRKPSQLIGVSPVATPHHPTSWRCGAAAETPTQFHKTSCRIAPYCWDFGTGAGFYVDATEQPWNDHYRMYSYVVDELPALIAQQFPVLPDRQGICGHSMGGHGALVCALRNPQRYRS